MTRLGRLVNGAYHFFSTELLPFPKKKKHQMYVSIDFLQIQFNGKHPQFWTPNRIGQVD